MVAALALVALLAATRPARAQFSVQPVIVEMETGDTTATREIFVRNEGSGTLQLRVYGADFDQAEAGGHTFMEPGTHPRSCADRVRFYPDGITLRQGESQQVRLLMEPVDSACWSMVFVEAGARTESGISVAHRIGVKVYGVTGRERPAGEIREVRVEGEAGDRAVRLTFANLGGRPLRPAGDLEVRTVEGDVLRVIQIAPFSVLPGHSRTTEVELGPRALAAGTYVLVPILDFGGDYLAGGQAVLEVPQE